MIKLDIEEYCHECPHFEVMFEQINKDYVAPVYDFSKDHNVIHRNDTAIYCGNKDRCANIRKHLLKGIEKEKTNE